MPIAKYRAQVLAQPRCVSSGTSNHRPNSALDLAPFNRWTLRDKAAQRRLALR